MATVAGLVILLSMLAAFVVVCAVVRSGQISRQRGE